MKAMVLAAGEGTRFRPQTLKLPKPALPLLNVPLGYYSFPFLQEVGVSSIVVNTFHLADKIENLYNSQNDFKVEFSHEKEKILGNGGGLGNAKRFLEKEKSFFLINADEVFVPHDLHFLSQMKRQHDASNAISTLLVKEHPEVGTKFGGIWINATGEVVGYGKTKPLNAVKGYHFLGIQMLRPDIFKYISDGVEQNILYDNLTVAQKAGQHVQIFETSGHWYETGSLTDYLNATRDILQNLKAGTKDFSELKKFLQSKAPRSSLRISNGAIHWIDETAKIDNCFIRDFAVVAEKATLRNVQMEAAVIGPSISIDSKSILNDFVI